MPRPQRYPRVRALRLAAALACLSAVALGAGCASTGVPRPVGETAGGVAGSSSPPSAAPGADGNPAGTATGSPTPSGPAGATPTPTSGASETPGSESSDPAADDLAGTVIALDPGHNGGNSKHISAINKQVPDGRGGTKPCNTTGTATNADYPEHAFNWDVALRVRKILEAHGAEVPMTRNDDKGVGPCVDVRGKFAAQRDADAMVSIHANGSPTSSPKGFHIIMSAPAVNSSQGKKSEAVALAIRKSMLAEGFPINKAIASDGISRRPDLAGLTTASRPAVIVECGEMRNGHEAAVMESAAGRQKYADAIAAGIIAWSAARTHR